MSCNLASVPSNVAVGCKQCRELYNSISHLQEGEAYEEFEARMEAVRQLASTRDMEESKVCELVAICEGKKKCCDAARIAFEKEACLAPSYPNTKVAQEWVQPATHSDDEHASARALFVDAHAAHRWDGWAMPVDPCEFWGDDNLLQHMSLITWIAPPLEAVVAMAPAVVAGKVVGSTWTTAVQFLVAVSGALTKQPEQWVAMETAATRTCSSSATLAEPGADRDLADVPANPWSAYVEALKQSMPHRRFSQESFLDKDFYCYSP